jgi:hypothetical protein
VLVDASMKGKRGEPPAKLELHISDVEARELLQS